MSVEPQLVDISSLPSNLLRHNPRPSPDIWGTACGSWGDICADMGIFRDLISDGGLVYYGLDPNIVDFLQAQPFVREVRYVKPISREEYVRLYSKMVGHNPAEPNHLSVSEIVASAGLRPDQVYVTSINQSLIARGVAHRWHGARLPEAAWSEARSILDSYSHQIRNGYCVLMPYSLASSGLEAHWPAWSDAIEWLLSSTPHVYVLCGKGWEMRGEHPRLINLLGATKTMSTVFALAEMGKAVVATSSALSHYCWINSIPAIIAGNSPLSNPDSYFRLLLQYPNISLVLFEESLARFITLGARLLA